jgi:hypothetical protein
VEDRARSVSSDDEEEEEEDDADANDGASPRDRERFPVPPCCCFLPLPLHDRFGEGRESFLARDWTESFILCLRCAAPLLAWRAVVEW